MILKHCFRHIISKSNAPSGNKDNCMFLFPKGKYELMYTYNQTCYFKIKNGGLNGFQRERFPP